MGALWQDVRYGARMLAKNPGFTAVAVLTLALGIGANTAIFSIVNSMLLRPLPVKNPEQITLLAMQQKGGPIFNQLSIADFRDIQNQSREIFSGVFGYQFGLDGLSVSGKADRLLTNYVSGNFFSELGVQPELGRLILPSEGDTPGADPVLVLAYNYWKTHFGGDPGIVGKQVSLDGHPVTIVGVAPRGFHGIYPILDVQGYLPLGMASIEGGPSGFMTNRGLRNFATYGRLKSGETLKEARASLGVVGQRLSQEYPQTDKDMSLQAYAERQSRPQPDPSNTLLVLYGLFLGLALMVLLLASMNVANILLVRATVREREMAIRAALGASRSQLLRQLLTESLLLGLLGGAAGLLFGVWGSSLLGSMHFGTEMPLIFDFSLDGRVFAYALAAALLTGLFVGVVPAIRATRGNLSRILHEGGRSVAGSRHRLRSALVIAQVGGSLMLLIIAGLFTRSLGNAQRSNLGFDPNHVLNLTMDPSEIGYSNAQGMEFYKSLLERVGAMPGIESASLCASVPMGYYNNFDAYDIPDYQPPAGQPEPASLNNVVSPAYFKTMKIPLLRGRAFTEADNETAPYVTIISDAMAKKYWPNTDPLGQEFRLKSDLSHKIRIVGIAKDSRSQNFTGPMRPFVFLPFFQHYGLNSLETLQVRTVGAPESMIPDLERLIATMAPDLPVFDVATMTQGLNTLNGLLVYKIGAGLAAILGILGLILAIVGVYGVVSYAASQRTHEIGIRVALGALQIDILKMIFRQGFFIVGLGLAVGLAAAAAAGRVVGNFLSVSALDPLTYISVSLLLTGVALLACYVPARRAMKVDPMVALRYE
ncbi:MAG: ABC transporter permease [Candidatus Acidiferrales bacterium]